MEKLNQLINDENFIFHLKALFMHAEEVTFSESKNGLIDVSVVLKGKIHSITVDGKINFD